MLSASIHHAPASAVALLCPDNGLGFGTKTSWKRPKRPALVPAAHGEVEKQGEAGVICRTESACAALQAVSHPWLCLLPLRPSRSPEKPTASRSTCRRARPSSSKPGHRGSRVCFMGCLSASRTPSTARYQEHNTTHILRSLGFKSGGGGRFNLSVWLDFVIADGK